MLASIALFAPAPLQAQGTGNGTSDWNQQIDRLYENLKVKLAKAESRLDSLKTKIEEKAQYADQDVRAHLDQLEKRIGQDRSKISAAQTLAKEWAESQKNATAAKIAGWKAKRDIGALQNRADRAERYAAAEIDIALAAVDDAEQAALEAWLARRDVNAAEAKKASNAR